MNGVGIIQPGHSARLQSSRRLDIQGLRALAVLMVVAYHAGLPTPGGFTGVDVFFVISGFVITGMLHREWLSQGRINFRNFYARRFRRLTPALAVLVSVVLLFSFVLLSPLGPQQNAAATGIGALTVLANLVIFRTTGGYFDAAAETNPLLNTWSLSVEEQFYLIFPALLVLGWLVSRRFSRDTRVTFLSISIVGVISFVAAFLGARGLVGPRTEFLFGFYGPVSRVWEFAAGALLALMLTSRSIRSLRLSSLLGCLGVLGLLASLFLITGDTPFPGPWTLLPVGSTVLLLAAGSATENPVTRGLSTRGLVKIGDWSYSIYLWHWPFIVLAVLIWPHLPWVAVAAALISSIPALASYRWVEQPLRKRPRLSMRIVLLTMFPPILIASALWIGASQGYWSSTVREFQKAGFSKHIGESRGCDLTQPLSKSSAAACTLNSSAPGTPIYLVGDSNADHFSEGLLEAAITLQRPLVISTTHACPFVDLQFRWWEMDDYWNQECQQYIDGTLKYLSSATSGTVVISNIDWYWASPKILLSNGTSPETSDTERKLQLFALQLERTVERLKEAGQQVILVQTVPQWNSPHAWDPKECSLPNIYRNACAATMPASDAIRAQGATRDALLRVAEASSTRVFDPWPVLCVDQTCSTKAGDWLRYFDANHLTTRQSREFRDAWIATLSDTSA